MEVKMRKPGFGIRELFGRAKPPYNRWLPAYLRLDWRVDDEEEREAYEPCDPPMSGDITLSYFAVSFSEWEEILNKYEEKRITMEEAEQHVKQVTFRTFPGVLDVWDVLLEKFSRHEITTAEVVMGMLKASKEANEGKG
jgi:hypothetical protein